MSVDAFMVILFFPHNLDRECLAWYTGTLAQLGRSGGPFRVRIRDVCVFPSPLNHHSLIFRPDRQGYPNIRTVDHWLQGDKSERYPQSRLVGRKGALDHTETTGQGQ